MQQAGINVSVNGGTIRVTVLVDEHTNRAAVITISRPWRRDESIRPRVKSELSRLYCDGQWDLQMLFDLLIPCPAIE